MYTQEYLNFRISQLVDCLAAVIIDLYPDASEYDCKIIDTLRDRLYARDYVRPNNIDTTRLAYNVKLAKRLTRFYIGLAIKQSPEWKADLAARIQAYDAECARIRKTSPDATFFSFSGSRYGTTKLKLSDYKKYFRIASEKELSEAKEYAQTFEKSLTQ